MGNEDDRALWPEMFRVIIECRPRWVVAENVPGIVDMALDGVLSDLENQGYEVGTMVIPACAVDAPHRRDRVWIVANSKSVGSESPRTEKPKSQGAERTGGSRTFVANSNNTRLERRESEELREHPGEFDAGQSDSSARLRCDRGQLESSICRVAHGIPGRMDGNFDNEPNIPRVATGIPDRAARLRALGNSIVPQVAYQIISNISKLEKSA